MNGIAVAADVVAVINDWVRDSFDCLRNRLYLPADSYRRIQCLRWCLGRMICLKSNLHLWTVNLLYSDKTCLD